MRTLNLFFVAALAVLCVACDHGASDPQLPSSISLHEVAQMLSELPLEGEHLCEVHDAVSSSSGNGYDEEYMMRNLFEAPGSGVGDAPSSTRAASYSRPLRSLVEDYLQRRSLTRAGGPAPDAGEYIAALTGSDIQIYWPYSENWDGSTMPIITFDPGTAANVNEGYEIIELPDGSRAVEKLIVDEATARNRPVWVVNRNDDSAYTSLEMLRRQDPSWSEGGTIVLRGASSTTRAAGGSRTLVLRDFTMNRNYDTWFAGGSEFFVKCGALEGFSASTEAEMKLYLPHVTDFLVVVKRRQMGRPVPFNAVLVSDWTEQLEEFAFMITEDDGGTTTSWKCEALVKVNSKSYGITMDLPFKTRDDIVWRGTLSSDFLDRFSGRVGHFGDIDLTFDFI